MRTTFRQILFCTLLIACPQTGPAQNMILPLPGPESNLASTLSTHYDRGDATATDPVERMSCRPDFSVLIYPVVTLNREFTHTGSRRALQDKGIPAALHIYPCGGHGYSMAIGRGHLSTWPDRVIEWIRYLYDDGTRSEN